MGKIVRTEDGHWKYMHYGFGKNTGLNTWDDPTMIADNQVQDLQNARVGGNRLSKREGAAAMNGTAIDATKAITSIMRRMGTDGTSDLYCTLDTKIYEYDPTGTSWGTGIGSGFTTGLYWRWTTAQNYVIGTNGTDAIQTVTGATVAALGGTPPVALDVCYHSPSSRLMIIPANDPSAVQWSPKNTINSWNALDLAYVARGAGKNLRLFDVGKTGLIVAKDRSIHVIRGPIDFRTDYTIEGIDTRQGMASWASGIAQGRDFYMLRSDRRFMKYDGYRWNDIGKTIQPTLDLINQAYMSNCYLSNFEGRLYLAVPSGTNQTTNNRVLVYDPGVPGWAFDVQPASVLSYADSAQETAPAMYYGNYAGKTLQLETPSVWQDAGASFTTILQFKDMDMNMPDYRKKYLDIFFTARASAAVNVTVDWYIDDDDITGSATVTLAANTYSFYRVAPSSDNCQGMTLSVKLTHADNGSFELLGWGTTFDYMRPMGLGVDQ